MNSSLGNKRLRTSVPELRRRFASYYQSSLVKLNQNGEKFVPANFAGQNREHAIQARQWRDEAVKGVKSATDQMR